MTTFEAPYYDIRVGAGIRNSDVFTLRARFDSLVRIDMHPPASGPEINLVFGQPVGAPPLSLERTIKIVERELGAPVLASRERGTAP